MSKPEDIRDDAMGIAVSIEKDIPSRVTGANRVFIRAVIARAIMAAEKRGEEREREACARVVEEGMHDRREAARAQSYQPIPVPVLATAIRARSA